jgi:hypothetical protein
MNTALPSAAQVAKEVWYQTSPEKSPEETRTLKVDTYTSATTQGTLKDWILLKTTGDGAKRQRDGLKSQIVDHSSYPMIA